MNSTREDNVLVLTGADHLYARTLYQFLLSAERVEAHRHADWIVYDLGLQDADRHFLRERFGWAVLKVFQFADYPNHVTVSSGSYAWKPIALGLHSGREGPLFWFDSGTVLKRRLDDVIDALSVQGFWALRSQEPLYKKCDVRVMDALGVPQEIRHFQEYAAGAVGFDTRTTLGRQILADWAAHAAIKDHIVPDGYPSFHKHDQALLNCLLATAAREGRFIPTTAEIDICSTNPSPLISTRNFVPNGRPLYADPLIRAGAALWKAGDVLYHRMQRLKQRR